MDAVNLKEETEVEKIRKVLSTKQEVISWIKYIILTALLYFIITNTIGLTWINGHSMDPTLRDGSLVLMNKFSTHFGSPSRGDVVVIHPQSEDYEIIKRIIGLPGDMVSIQNGTVYVNEEPLLEIYVLGNPNDMDTMKVKQGHMFVIGDNRIPGESLDSRDPDIGQLPITSIKGYTSLSLFPFYKIMKPIEL